MLILPDIHSGFIGYEIFANGRSAEYFESGTGDDQFRSTPGRKLSTTQMASSRFDPVSHIGDILCDLDATVLPAAVAPTTENKCMLVGGEGIDSGLWRRIDALSVPQANLPAENYMNVEP